MAHREHVVRDLAELFREQGFAATSLPSITAATGLGKGSLYNLFPGGKAQMLGAVVEDVSAWFEERVFAVLREPEPQLTEMFAAVSEYFDSGRRLCLIGRVGIEPGLESLNRALSSYFTQWIGDLRDALQRSGVSLDEANGIAEDVVSGIQGALIVAHTTSDSDLFTRSLARMQDRVLTALPPQ
ncbi:TetR/AcrR family transcriptional regulator [Timonella sp. A28]|uniref:TetR/AcrR family transcriptional regulator n=1 Tax=Timonella sp. A28 TaxID=3442640 RepID=UPI003EB6AE78